MDGVLYHNYIYSYISIYSGFLCGRCTKGSENTGIALNLIECVPCDVSDIIYFILLCKFIA